MAKELYRLPVALSIMDLARLLRPHSARFSSHSDFVAFVKEIYMIVNAEYEKGWTNGNQYKK